MSEEGVTPGICQSGSTATFSTLFPLSSQLQKKNRGVRELRVIAEIIKGQPTKDFSTKALIRVLNFYGKSGCNDSHAVSLDTWHEQSHHHRSILPKTQAQC